MERGQAVPGGVGEDWGFGGGESVSDLNPLTMRSLFITIRR